MNRHRHNLCVEWSHPPAGCVEMAKRRTADMVTHYGNNIRVLTLETLVASAYLQGAADMLTVLDKPSQPPLDFEI